jgi:S-adenosylmethionine hydrolase
MIALFTDFGTRDAYVAQLKGAIVSINPHAVLLDLNHEVGQFNIRQAAYLLERSAAYFPAATIFVAVIDPGVGSLRRPLLLRTRANKFYVGPDNGLFSGVIAREGLQAAHVLRETAYYRLPAVSVTFHGRDIFGPVAAHLSLGVSPACFGPGVTDVLTFPPPRLSRQGSVIAGEILHIDHFGNLLTNIPPECLTHVRPRQQLSVTIGKVTVTLPFCTTYADARPGELVCLFSSNAEFEIARVQGNAADSFAAQAGATVVLRC